MIKTLLTTMLLVLSPVPFERSTKSALPAESVESACQQDKVQQRQLIARAQKRNYVVRRLELIGNEHTGDHELRRKILLQEGDPFRRSTLIRSLTNLSKLKAIYRVDLNAIIIHLNDDEKTVDVTFCVSEKPRASLEDGLWAY